MYDVVGTSKGGGDRPTRARVYSGHHYPHCGTRPVINWPNYVIVNIKKLYSEDTNNK